MIIQPVAAGQVVGASGVMTGNGGTMTRVSAGVYDLTLVPTGVPIAQAVITFLVTDALGGGMAVSHISDTVKRFRTRSNGANVAADRNFNFQIHQLQPTG